MKEGTQEKKVSDSGFVCLLTESGGFECQKKKKYIYIYIWRIYICQEQTIRAHQLKI